MHRSSAEYEAFSSITASYKARVIAQALHVMKRKTEVEKKLTTADKQRLKMRRKDSGRKTEWDRGK